MSKIHTQMNDAMRDIVSIGIGKTQKNEAQGYTFRGVEQAMNEMAPILVNHGIVVTARYTELVVTERIKGDPKDGKAMRFVTIKGHFTFMADDDSMLTAEAYGEAMDSGDKAVIKAQSVSFRSALFQAFVVPTMSMDSELNHGEGGDLEDRRRKWLDDQLKNIAEAASVGSLKSIMEHALSVVRENKDQEAEDELLEASAVKVAKANPAGRKPA